MPTPVNRGQPTKLNCEVAVFSGTSGLEAQALGAARIELNAPGSYEAGGLTPPVEELTSVNTQLDIPVRIMIRPRGAPQAQDQDVGGELQDFIYTDAEIATMMRSIEAFKATNVLNPIRGDGFVFGVLERQTSASQLAKYPDVKYTIDKQRCMMLVDAARPFPCVFHRAFDLLAGSERWHQSVNILLDCGFDGVLTSGGIGNCAQHLDRIDAICHRAEVGSMQVIAGGGVRRNNVRQMVAQLSVHGTERVWIHTAALVDKVDKDGRRLEEIDAHELTGIISAIRSTSPD